MRTRGVLALAAPRRSLFSNPESRRQIEAYATLIAIALERLHYVEVAQQALVSMESEKLRNSLLAAVSHDLRTPLTSLVGMTDTLARQQPVLPADVQDTIRAMRDQASACMRWWPTCWTWPGCKAATRRCGWNGSR